MCESPFRPISSQLESTNAHTRTIFRTPKSPFAAAHTRTSAPLLEFILGEKCSFFHRRLHPPEQGLIARPVEEVASGSRTYKQQDGGLVEDIVQ